MYIYYLYLGELYRGERGVGTKKVSFTIRVYPFNDYQLRTQEKCCEVIQELVNSSNPTNNNMSNRTKKKKETKKKKKEKTSLYGHLGKALFILEILRSNDGFKL